MAALGAVLGGAVLALTACGGGTDRTKAQMRMVNASSGYAQLDYRVDDQLRQGAVAYGETASYVEVDPGKASTTITAAGSPTALLSFTPGVSAKKYYTVLAYGVAGALKQLLLDENSGDPDTNRSFLRVVNAAPDAGALDVYLTGSADTLDASVPVLSGASVDQIGGYITLISSTWRLRVTATGSKTDVRLDVPAVTFGSKQITTLVLTPGSGGVLVKGLLLNQQASIAPLAATQARVRVAAGVASGGTVTASLAGTALLSGISSPAVSGQYTLVSAGAQTLTVSVNGLAPSTTPVALTAGADYTVLVYGTAAAPQVALVADDNRLALDRSLARVRLVNGTSGLATPLALTVDYSPLADNIGAGQASAYATLSATTTARVAVTTTGAANPLFSAVDQTFTAASNYTVFLVGAAASPVGILRKDR
jgi:hypothetical protein